MPTLDTTAGAASPPSETPARARTRLGITGTSTGVGKTVVTTALIAALRDVGARVAAMKPVETGESTDALMLHRAIGETYPLDIVRPYTFPDPAAPLVAARRLGTMIDMRALDESFDVLDRSSDTVLVEGAGGLLVPITDVETFATLFERWSLDLILVAANQLGVINHTLLTVHAAYEHRIAVRAIVLNTITPNPPSVAEATNHSVLTELLPAIPIIPFPYLAGEPDTAMLVAAARPILPALSSAPLPLPEVVPLAERFRAMHARSTDHRG